MRECETFDHAPDALSFVLQPRAGEDRNVQDAALGVMNVHAATLKELRAIAVRATQLAAIAETISAGSLIKHERFAMKRKVGRQGADAD